MLLASYIVPANTILKAAKSHQALHALALNKITELGTTYADDFKLAVQSSTALRATIETALKAHQLTKSQYAKSQISAKPATKAAPSIQLRTDFSNFLR